MTNCEHVESLLPAYAEGDVTPEERGRVDAHVGECEACRQSLAFFVGLEETLVERRRERPSDRAAARRVARRLGLRWRPRFVPDMGGLPVAASAAFVGLGIAMFVARDAVREFFARVGTTSSSGALSAWISELLRSVVSALEVVSAGSVWTWVAVYAGCLALIFLSGTWMVLRWVRD